MKFSTIATLVASVAVASAETFNLKIMTGDQLNQDSYLQALPEDNGRYYGYSDRSGNVEWSVEDGKLKAQLVKGDILYGSINEYPDVTGVPVLQFDKKSADEAQDGWSIDDRGYLRANGSINWFLCFIDTPKHYNYRAVALFDQEPVNGKPPHDGCETIWMYKVPLVESF